MYNYDNKWYFTTVNTDSSLMNQEAVEDIQKTMENLCVVLPDEEAVRPKFYTGIGWSLGVSCTQVAYVRFTEVIEHKYPGLCDFDVYNQK